MACSHSIFLPLFLFLFLPLFFVCRWQSVCFICGDLQANIYKHYKHFILQQSCKIFAPFFSCKARAIKFLCCPPKSDTLHFFCPFFSFIVLQQSCKRLYFINGVAMPQFYFLPLFFHSFAVLSFLLRLVAIIFCPFFRLPLAVGLFFLFGF